MGEPFWVDDHGFDIADHVLQLGARGEELDDLRFGLLCERVLRDRASPFTCWGRSCSRPVRSCRSRRGTRS
ncbi:MAG TPA: hypothetical protein VI122_18685, partial [Thermoleophilaceae bacterium]